MKHPVIFSFILFFLFSSCTQNLVPAWFDPEVHSSKDSRMDFDGLTIITENLEVNDQHLVFDVEIRNHTTHPVHVKPEVMYYLGSEVPFPPETRDHSGSSFESNLKKNLAIGEKEVGNQLGNKIKAQRRTGILLGILSAGLMIYDVAMDAKDFNSGEWTAKKANNAVLRDVVTMASLTAMDVVQQQSAMTAQVKGADLFYLPDEILRSNLLAPGASCRGKVFFPSTKDKYIKVIIPIDNTEYAFEYRWAEAEDMRKLQRVR
jgi:hypothetical protein